MPSQVKSEPMSQAVTPVVEMGYEEEHYEDYSQEYGQDTGQGYEGGVLSGGADGNKGKNLSYISLLVVLAEPNNHSTKWDKTWLKLECLERW